MVNQVVFDICHAITQVDRITLSAVTQLLTRRQPLPVFVSGPKIPPTLSGAAFHRGPRNVRIFEATAGHRVKQAVTLRDLDTCRTALAVLSLRDMRPITSIWPQIFL
jgi:hypothetical protein